MSIPRRSATVHAVLDRHGLVKRRGRRRNKAAGTPLSTSDQPNDLWCADYKGEFMLADRRYCYPLTITDFASRFPHCLRSLAEHQGGLLDRTSRLSDSIKTPSSRWAFKRHG
jgi:hypothetical protein